MNHLNHVNKIVASLTHRLLMSKDEAKADVLRESLFQYVDIQKRLEREEILTDVSLIRKDLDETTAILKDIRSML